MFSNITFNENTNNNKVKCGQIHFQKNITVSIINSKFIENTSKGNGGVLYEVKYRLILYT